MNWRGLSGGFIAHSVLGSLSLLFAALPATTNYQLNSYGFGSGGTANASTATYALEGTTGEVSGATAATSTYSLKPGFTQTQQAHIPKLSALDNGSNTFYNKLHFVIDTQSNPTDALYAISVSTDNFASNVQYVKSDMTLGSSLVVADYQTYAAFGGSGGANIIGLSANTTYYVRLKATQGKFTESGFGPITSATTAGAQLSFSLSTNSVAMGALLPASVISGAPVNLTFATNAASGGDIYISGKNGGLTSSQVGGTLSSLTGDLDLLSRGYGAQVTAIGASSGTFSKVSPYNLGTNNVGLVDAATRRIITATGPIVGGTGSVTFKAKAASNDKAGSDYTDTATMLASANY